MTYLELVNAIKELSLEERLSLLEMLARSVHHEVQATKSNKTSLHRVRRMLKPNGPIPADDELEDAVQHACATADGLDAIVTRNIEDFKSATIPIYSPTDFRRQFVGGADEK